MCTQRRTRPSSRRAEIASSKSLRVVGVDRERGQVAEVHARVRRVRVGERASRLRLDRAREARAAGRGRASAPRARRARGRGGRAGAPRARRACRRPPARGRRRRRRRARRRVRGPAPNSGSATRKRPLLLEHRDQRLVDRRAGRPRTAALIGSSRASVVERHGQRLVALGVRVVARPDLRLDPLGRDVLAARAGSSSPTVRSSAPPFESGSTSWHTPLPNVRVPTTVARLAVAQRAGHDLGRAARCRRPRAPPPGCPRRSRRPRRSNLRSGRVRPARRDDLPVLDEDARHEHGLAQQAAAVAAQVEHDASAPLVEQLVDLPAQLPVRAGAEARAARRRRASCPSRSRAGPRRPAPRCRSRFDLHRAVAAPRRA